MQLDMMSFERDGRIGYLTLNRPTVLNAMNYQGALDLNCAAERIRDGPHVRLVLIRWRCPATRSMVAAPMRLG
jgi:enoyl-CoA hydratase/carnithine racemase